ncbi:MAG: hypothetical protein Q9226_005768 [Calogaya cf. arnoldii]
MDIDSTDSGQTLQMVQKTHASRAKDRIYDLRQSLKAYNKSVGFRDRIRFMFSQQEMAEKAAFASRGVQLLQAANWQCEKLAESLYRQQQHQANQELKSRLKVLEVALQLTELKGVSAMESAKPLVLNVSCLHPEDAEDINGLLDSIDDLEMEILTSPLSLSAVMDLRATVEGPTLTRDHSELESTAIQQISELRTLADRFSKGYSSFQRLRHRGRFLFEKQELSTRRAKVDIAVKKTRSAAIRYEVCVIPLLL